MVFEAVVSNQLNKFLGAYIENVNSSQLKLGLLGGDVVLNRLVLKQSALDKLDLPVKIVAGHIDELVLKIPWTNIYSSRTQVCIKGLYLLAIPNQAVAYDADKERVANKKAKERQLFLIEEAKARETAKAGNPEENGGFVYKLVAQILQNLLVTVEDVHIRFEDNVTNPHHPFAFGMTLKKLALESTDESWVPTLISELSKQFYKLLSLECLSIYWLSNTTQLLSAMNSTNQLEHFREGIANVNEKPYGDSSYIAHPITSYSKLRINTRPDLDGSNYTIPRVFVNLELEEILMALNSTQYDDIVGFLGEIERLHRALPYRKYRPVLCGYKKYAQYWWLFAYQCVLEENVRRRRRNWCWSHMKEHKDRVRQYIDLYRTKLCQKKEDVMLRKNLEELESHLDVFNITLARRQAELQIERVRANEQKTKDEAQQNNNYWFGGWFGIGASSAAVNPKTAKVVKSLQAEMTPDEKKKLYSAIGYEENAVPVKYPKTFIENCFEFFLQKLVILLRDHTNRKEPVILLSSLSRVEAIVEQRPAAQALRAAVKVGGFIIDGTPQKTGIPSLVRPLEDDKKILTLMYETNPLDESCDQRVRLAVESLLITYDVKTFRNISTMFKSKEAAQLTQITAVARQQLKDLKKTTASGLEYAIQNQAVLDVDVNIKGSYLVLPFGGRHKNNSGKILCNMGNFTMKSLDGRKRRDESKVSQLMRVGSTEKEILEEIVKSSYIKFSLRLHDVQVLSVLPNEDLTLLLKETNTDAFILKPMSIELMVEKCLVLDDLRLPKLKVSGQLPSIHIDVLDTRLINFAAVLKSIPSPTPENVSHAVVVSVVPEVELPALIHRGGKKSALEHLENVFKFASNEDGHQDPNNLPDDTGVGSSIEERQLVQPTDLMLRFEFQDVRLSLSVAQDSIVTKPVLSFGMENLILVCTKKTFETVVDLTLKDLSLNFIDRLATDGQQKSIKIINSYDSSKELLCVHFVDVDKQSPEFHARHRSVVRKLEVVISYLDCDFHQEAVIDLLQLSTDIKSRIDEIVSIESTGFTNPAAEIKSQLKVLVNRGKPKRRRTKAAEVVDFQFKAQLDYFAVNVLTRKLRLAEITISGLKVETSILASHIVFETGLNEFRIANPNDNTLYREIVSIEDGRAIQSLVKIFKNATEGVDTNQVDLEIRLKMSRMKIVYLSSFVKDLLAFVNHFQTAKEAFIKASSAAATAVKENMEKVYVKATRILLDIEFQAPYIIIPQRSDSADALIIDLGYFTLKNRFDLRKIHNEIGSPAIMDSISLNLLELRVVLAVVDGMKGKSEKKLIKPLSFSLDLIRNLSSAWYSEEPELRVDVDLGKLSIFLSDFAYRKLMKIVSDNLEEGQIKLTEEATDKIKRRESSRPICAIEEKPIYLPTSLSSELSKENPLLSSQSSELPEDRIPVAPQTPVIADFASESLDPIVIRPTVRQYLPHPSPPSPPSPCCCGFCSCCVFL